MEKLQDLTQSELEELLGNAERLESMALESDEIQNIQLEREMALASNRSLAEQNLDMKPQLERQREKLVERYSQLEAVHHTYIQHSQQREGMVGQVSPEGLFSRLQAEGASTEEESETLADEFLDGSLPLDSFLERFLALRSLAHRRRVRTEKLQEILRQKNDGTAGDASAVTSSTCAKPDPVIAGVASSPWTTTPNNQPAQGSVKPSGHATSYPNAPQPAVAGASSGLPYIPYPVSPPNQPVCVAASGPANPPSQFPPYPSPGSSFTPTGSYAASRPAFGPPACPYPTQPSFPGPPGPHPGSAFGQYNPQSAPYPASYSYGGYSYPAGPNGPSSQSPTARPMCRPGYGVPQPYS